MIIKDEIGQTHLTNFVQSENERKIEIDFNFATVVAKLVEKVINEK